MPHPSSLAVVILAAGKGTRMKSPRAKVLHEVFYQPMLHHVLHAVQPLRAGKTIVIVGHQRQAVEQALDGYGVHCVEQEEQNGTGHAVLCAETALAGFSGDVMILCGDSPLLLSHHIEEMHNRHAATGSELTIMTTTLEEPANYGRIIRDRRGVVAAVVEEKDATPEQRRIGEINAGIYCAEKTFLFNALQQVTTDNSQKEMYLTDIVEIAVQKGLTVGTYEHPHPDHVLGVNSRIELARAHGEIQARRNNDLMASGITMLDPRSISVAPTARVAPDCVLAQQVVISGTSTIGSGCHIEAGVILEDADIGNDVHIGAHSVLNHCRIEDHEVLPPLSYVDGRKDG